MTLLFAVDAVLATNIQIGLLVCGKKEREPSFVADVVKSGANKIKINLKLTR